MSNKDYFENFDEKYYIPDETKDEQINFYDFFDDLKRLENIEKKEEKEDDSER